MKYKKEIMEEYKEYKVYYLIASVVVFFMVFIQGRCIYDIFTTFVYAISVIIFYNLFNIIILYNFFKMKGNKQ